jgi:hypothetical protein
MKARERVKKWYGERESGREGEWGSGGQAERVTASDEKERNRKSIVDTLTKRDICCEHAMRDSLWQLIIIPHKQIVIHLLRM